MKRIIKIIIFFITLLIQINIIQASKLDVKTNLESWEYEFAIEVNIITNDKNAKIFYYTDWEWRMDNIKEFKKPILIKEDTQLDYYATNANYEDTLIKTSNYTFNYSKQIDIFWDEKKIIIKNNSSKIQNIWYWKIEANNLNYEILPNTFLDEKKTFEINYFLENLEEIKLISPDKKVIKSFVYKKPAPKEINSIVDKKLLELEIKDIVSSDNNNVKTSFMITKESKNQEEIIRNENINSLQENNEKQIKSSWFSLQENLKTSTFDTKKTWNKNNIYIIILIFWSLILYNVLLLLQKTEKFKKIKKNKK